LGRLRLACGWAVHDKCFGVQCAACSVTADSTLFSVLSPYPQTADAEGIAATSQQWVERVVIGLNLCPFAKAVHAKRQIRYAVTAAVNADDLLAELEHEVAQLIDADPADLETTLLIHPLVMVDFLDYHFFLAEADAALRRLEVEGVLQIAGFHPDFQFANSAHDDMANFTNRSPHPILHLLREASVDRAVAAFPNAADIFEANIQTLRTLGYEGWRKL
jgi:uncharacterized protein